MSSELVGVPVVILAVILDLTDVLVLTTVQLFIILAIVVYIPWILEELLEFSVIPYSCQISGVFVLISLQFDQGLLAAGLMFLGS